MKWNRKITEHDHAGAQFCLGDCFNHGKGVGTDKTEPVEWHRKAAEQDHEGAQFCLGGAVKWHRKAAAYGNSDAQCNLHVCFVFGEGVVQDNTGAVKKGHAGARVSLGDCECYIHDTGWQAG